MKPILLRSLLAPLAFLAACCGPLESSSKLAAAGPNGGFEHVEDGRPAQWIVYESDELPSGRYELTFDATDFTEGAQSLRFDVAQCISDGGWRSPGITQEREAESGATHELKFQVKAPASRWRACFGGVSAKHGRLATLEPESPAPAGWHEVRARCTLPEGSDRLRFEFNVLSPGRVWLDDVRIERVEE